MGVAVWRRSIGWLLATTLSCRVIGDPPSPVIEAAAAGDALFIAPGRVEIPRGFTQTEVVSVRTFTGKTPDVTWSSSDSAVVSVVGLDGRTGKLTGRAGGSAKVTATTADGRRATIDVLVTVQPPTRFNPIAPRERIVDGLHITASTRADSAPANAVKGAVLYTTRATIANRSGAERVLSLGACALWLTIHDGGGWYMEDMRPLAWDQLVSGQACTDEPKTVRLPPGASYSTSTSVFAHDLVAKIGSNRAYYFHAHVRFDTTEVVVAADSAVISYPSSEIGSVASTTVVGADTSQSLRTVVTLRNNGALPMYLEYGACAARLLAYKTADRSGQPVWNSDLRRPWHGAYGIGCISILYARTIQPGDTLSQFGVQSPLIEMLADSLPDGRYYFAADVGFSNRPPLRGIPAGSLDLTLPRAPLATSRASDLLTFTALPVTVSGSTVTARATARLDYAGSAIMNFSRDCPITLYAYRDRTRRDTAPRSGPADWTQPISCGSDQVSVTMYRGESRSVETTVQVRDILGSSLPSGRYYFAVALRAERNRVFLSAGEADLVR